MKYGLGVRTLQKALGYEKTLHGSPSRHRIDSRGPQCFFKVSVIGRGHLSGDPNFYIKRPLTHNWWACVVCREG